MVKAASKNSSYPHTYHQALEDFSITELLSHLRAYADADFNAQLMNLEEQELESIAAILIQWLTKNLKGKQIASYLNAIRYGDSDVLFDPTCLDIPQASSEVPANFPKDVTPRYQDGDRVQWRSLNSNTDWGIIIGHYYAYAKHQCSWAVCYLVRLDRDSPSAAWTVTDTAWEDDLEPYTDNGSGKSGDGEIGSRGDGQSSLALHPMPGLYPNELNEWATLTHLSPAPIISKSLHTPPAAYDSGGGNRINPRPLTQREENLIKLYSQCQLAMTPMRFYAKWSVNYDQIAAICDRSISTVRRWFIRGRYYRRPARTDLRHLAIMDFLLEHFEEIPSKLRNLLCSPNLDQ
jgi:hypothetical protein